MLPAPLLPQTRGEPAGAAAAGTGHLLSAWAKAQKGPRGQQPVCRMSLHLVDL